MHLLILHQAWVFGGAERTTRNLLTGLDRSLISRLTLAAPKALYNLMPPAFDHYVDTAGWITHGWYGSPAALARDVSGVAKVLERCEPDVVLGMMHYSASLAVLGAAQTPLPTRTIASFRGPLSEHTKRYETGAERLAFLQETVSQTARLADRVVVPSPGTAEDTIVHYAALPERTVVIPNGIDAAEARGQSQQHAVGLDDRHSARPLVCVAARLSPEKGLPLLFQAFAAVRDTLDCALLVVGDGPMRSELQERAKVAGLTEDVFFVGHQSNVFPYLSSADLFVHTCQFEGFGYAMLEAMACGVPVIATDCPHGPRYVLEDGACGVLVPPDNEAALAEAMLSALGDSSLWQRLRRAGLARAEQLSVRRMVQAYEQVFVSLR